MIIIIIIIIIIIPTKAHTRAPYSRFCIKESPL